MYRHARVSTQSIQLFAALAIGIIVLVAFLGVLVATDNIIYAGLAILAVIFASMTFLKPRAQKFRLHHLEPPVESQPPYKVLPDNDNYYQAS